MNKNEQRLLNIAKESHAKLMGLSVDKNCWCGVGIGDPRLHGEHDENCIEVREFVKSLEHTIKSINEQGRTES